MLKTKGTLIDLTYFHINIDLGSQDEKDRSHNIRYRIL